ncbi:MULTISPECIES: YbaY family lipoprotein [unclassified Pseudomonas]|uniref:YbaY family lipoprotein n=1 Tax=unclassified Pseudomonas TaxID=196821 RepID=UPI002448BA3E|nr:MULTISPECIES: YbaY family lipoprotein [unclassified Pseudomonas]MDG9925096.1 YbaY family lipoprotein [Pseudomonas sp. GD04045]MDH0037029.1 YbaY family lipoprotein [Pseudomonas sp. GD04019]
MLQRPALACLTLLLAACASEPPKPVAPAAPPRPAPVAKPVAPQEQALPAHMRELRGSLLTPPPGSEVEMALLVVDERDRPQQLLGSLKLAGDGQALAFRLPFNPEYFPSGARVELRARISQSGRLILRLPPQRVTQAVSRDFGALSLVSAP